VVLSGGWIGGEISCGVVLSTFGFFSMY
jgi:hypothetical protein